MKKLYHESKRITNNKFFTSRERTICNTCYQRNYDWKNAECNELLHHIIAVETEKRGTHFIGSIVYIHEGIHLIDDVKELVIIDGQQRLPTINMYTTNPIN